VVGRELFDSARLRIDIAGRQVSAVGRSATPPGKRLPLTTVHGVEAIPVSVNGTAALAEFDLGNGSDVLISRALARKLKLKVVGTRSGGGIGGQVRRDLVSLASLDVAGKRFRNLVAAVDDQANAGELNLGTSVLRHFLITSDFGQRAVWLEPIGRQ
jgi:hypothetical protein